MSWRIFFRFLGSVLILAVLYLDLPAQAQPVASLPSAPALNNGVPGSPGPTSAAEDIHDIRGPRIVKISLFWPLCAGVFLLLLAAFYFLWIRRRPRVKPLSSWEKALARLAKARSLLMPESTRVFSIEVSEIARSYIEERFQVWAARRTTEEFLYDLLGSQNSALISHRALLQEFLRYCDLAKFAQWSLSSTEMENMYLSLESFIRGTGLIVPVEPLPPLTSTHPKAV